MRARLSCNEMICDADISSCGKFRLSLTRIWDKARPVLAIIGLNPSTADAFTNDNTITREIDFARRLGHGGFVKGNVFAYRSTDRSVLKTIYPISAEQDKLEALALLNIVKGRRILAAWGNDALIYANWGGGTHRSRAAWAMELLGHRRIECFGRTANDMPKHTLYLPKTAAVEIYHDGEAVELPPPVVETGALFG